MVINNSTLYRRNGFTLVEIMIAAICLTIILGPILMILRSSTDTSLKGMMRIETTLKARNILHQVYADLKSACFISILGEQEEFCFNDVVAIDGTVPNYIYTFNSFPVHQKYDNIFESPSSGVNYRKTSQITYRVENGTNANLKFKKLIREEIFDGKTTKTVLSENVNFFEIQQIPISIDNKIQYYYLITLQLIDVLHASDLKGKETTSDTGEKLTKNQKDIMLADFYDIVYPDFFFEAWNSEKSNPNWHTFLKSPLAE